MGTTQQKLNYLANAVSGIKSAIEARGVVVGNAPLAQYATKIEEIPSDNIASVVDKSVTEITLDMLEGATEIGDYTFYGCADLTTIHIPNTVTSIGDYAFYGCTSITTIYFHGTSAQWESVTKGTNWDGNTGEYSVVYGSAGLAFTSNGDGTCYVRGVGTCTDLDLVIPAISPDGDSVTSIGEDAFYYYTEMTSVVIPDSVTSIRDFAFCGCTGLTSVTIPDSVTNIGNYAFSGCSGLTGSMIIPDSVQRLNGFCFAGCTGLTNIFVGSGLIYASAPFDNCRGLSNGRLEFKSVNPPDIGDMYGVSAGLFGGASSGPNMPPCLLYVPAQSVDTYKNDSKWSYYSEYIQAIVG